MRPEEPQASIGHRRASVLQRQVLGQCVSQAHDHAPLDLSLDTHRIYRPAYVMGGHHPADPACFVQFHQMGGIAVRNVAHRMLLGRAQLVGNSGIFGVEIDPLHVKQGAPLQSALQLHGGPPRGLAGEEGLPRSGRVS